MVDGLPTTFEQRGVLVNFRHRFLCNIWLRLPERPAPQLRELQAAIQNFSGISNRHFLVLPWLQVPTLAEIGTRDRILFDTISNLNRIDRLDPYELSALTLQIDRDHAESEEMRSRALRGIEQLKYDRYRAYVGLLVKLTRECVHQPGDPDLSGVDAELLMAVLADGSLAGFEGDSFLTGIYQHLCRRIGVTEGDLAKRLDRLADVCECFGGIAVDQLQPHQGSLRRRLARLTDFRAQLVQFERTASVDVANFCLLVIFAARQYIDLVEQQLRDVDGLLASVIDTVRTANDSLARLTRLRRQIAFALDGWESLIDLWDPAWAAADRQGGVIRLERAVVRCLQVLPLMPTHAINGAADKVRIWTRYQTLRARPLPQMYNWLDETPDQELIDRVEAARSRQAGPGPPRGRR